MITKDSIENLKAHIDIVDIISNFLELKKYGSNYKACCPFHQEDTPSFVVSPTKQIFHCFGCGIGGDSIKFVMEYEKISYPQALEKIANLANISLQYDNKNEQLDYSVINKLNQYYSKLLTQNNTAKQYLYNRGVSDFSIEKFEIGFANTSNDTIHFLKKNFLNLNTAKDFGLIDSGENGLYARFINRIIFPIYNPNNALVGFGGRTITQHPAKYINSPQTKFFNKSKLLYGYHLAKENIYKQKAIIISEGYLDVVMLHQAGFTNSVATLGTALTKEHLPLIQRGEPKVILAYDGDKAGIEAAYKASVLLSIKEFDGGVVIFDQDTDPADLVKDNKLNILNNLLLHPKNFIEFVIDYIIKQYDISKPLDKQIALKETNDYIKKLSPILQEEYQSYIARKLNINTQLVQIRHHNQNRNINSTISTLDIAELSIIKTFLEFPKYFNELNKDILTKDLFQTHQDILETFLSNQQDEKLNFILLNEDIKTYTKQELDKQLSLLLRAYYTKKIQQLTYDTKMNFRQKSKKLENINKKYQI
jgi:DNA primase